MSTLSYVCFGAEFVSEEVITVTAADQRKSNPRAAMVRAEVRSARGYANQRAHDLRLGPQPAYVDGSRSHLNRIVMEPPTAPEMRKIVEERRAQRETSRALKSNARIAVVGVIGFGIEAARLFAQLTPEQQDKAVLEAGQRIAEIANTTMVGAVIHLDETSTHAHLSFCGYDLDGVPLSSTMKRGMLTKFQDVLAQVMSEHCPGIERGNSRWDRIKAGADFSDTVHKSVRELHEDLPKDIAEKREELEQVSAEIPKLENRVAEMQARVDKLENEEKQRELTATKVKRLRTYRSRLTDRIGDLRGARDELNRLTAEIEAKQKLVTDLERRADQAEERAARATERAQEAKQTASAAEERKSEVEASVAALEAEKAALDADVSTLIADKAQLEPEISSLKAQRGEVYQDAKKLLAAKKKIEADNIELDRQGREMESKVAAVQESLEFLRPAHAAAQALSALTEVNQTTRSALFDAMSPNPEQTEDGGEQWALAIRMCDPDFAVDVARHVPRAYVVQTNHETLADHDLVTDEDFGKLIAEMRKEPGGLDAVLALQRREISVEDLDGPADTPAKSWLGRAFDGVKRGFVYARAAVSEKSVALAGLFQSLPEPTQLALTRLFRSREPEPEPDETRRSVFDPRPGP